MKKVHFDNLAAAAAACVASIDELAGPYTAAVAADSVYNDDTRRQRAEIRNSDTARQMTAAVNKAQQTAAVELEAMRKAYSSYTARLDNPAALRVAEALVKTDPAVGEIMALAENTTDFITLKVLQPYSKGRIKLPDAAALEHDLADVKMFFDLLSSYSGPGNELKDCIGQNRPFGLSAGVAGTVARGQAKEFAAKMETMNARWQEVQED